MLCQTSSRFCYWFQGKFRIHKKYINTSKIICKVSNHHLNNYHCVICKMESLQIQLIEQVIFVQGEDIDKLHGKRKNSGNHSHLFLYMFEKVLMVGALLTEGASKAIF